MNVSTGAHSRPVSSQGYTCYDASVILILPTYYREAYILSATLNAIFSVMAILGNSLVLAALPRVSSLKPPTKVLIGSLALSDLCVGLTVEPLFLIYIVAGLVGDPAVRCYARVAFGLGSDYVVAMSYLTMTSITLDRFLVIRLGIQYRAVVTFRRTLWAMGICWLLCGVFPVIRVLDQKISLVLIIFGFFLCLGISSVANFRIYKLLQEHEAQLNRFDDLPENYINLKRYRKFLHMVLIVFAAHLACYLPSMGIPLVLLITKKTDLMMIIANFLGTLLLYNSALNPFLYMWQLRQMHQEVIRMIHCGSCKPITLNYSKGNTRNSFTLPRPVC